MSEDVMRVLEHLAGREVVQSGDAPEGFQGAHPVAVFLDEIDGIQAEPEAGEDEALTDEPKRMFVESFEGAIVTTMRAKFPSLAIGMDEGFARGTHLRLELDVRVKSVRHEEGRDGNLIREHVLAVESVLIRSNYRPEDARDGVAGSASGTPTQTPEQAEELGVEFGRTSDLWGKP